MRVHKKTQLKMRKRVRELTNRRKVNSYTEWRKSIRQYVVGWTNYYKLADMGNFLKNTDEWMRRRIRMVFWKKWKRVRTRYKNLRKLGLSHECARKFSCTRKGYWRVASSPILTSVLTNQRLEKDGFTFFTSYYRSVAA